MLISFSVLQTSQPSSLYFVRNGNFAVSIMSVLFFDNVDYLKIQFGLVVLSGSF